MHGLGELLDRTVLEDQVHDVVLEGQFLVLGEGQPFLLHKKPPTLTASSSNTRMKTLVSSSLHSSSTLGALYQK